MGLAEVIRNINSRNSYHLLVYKTNKVILMEMKPLTILFKLLNTLIIKTINYNLLILNLLSKSNSSNNNNNNKIFSRLQIKRLNHPLPKTQPKTPAIVKSPSV